jgi:hypothetical protein
MEPVLTRVQENEIYAAITNAGLAPADFDHDMVEESYRGSVERFVHRPTRANFRVSSSDKSLWLTFWPSQNRNYRSFADSWREVLPMVRSWLADVRTDHDAPDLWGEIRKARLEADASAHPELLQPFSAAERKQLEAGLDELEEFVVNAGPPDPSRTQAIRGRFAYIRGAASRAAAKIDWWNLFAGQVVGMVTEGLLSSTVYPTLMAHAKTAPMAVFKFTAPLLLP